MIATLPFVLIIIDYLKLSSEEGWRKKVKSWLPYWGVLVFYAFVRFAVVPTNISNKLASLALGYRLLTFGRAIIYYLQKLIWPVQLSSYVVIDLVTKGLPIDVLIVFAFFFGSILFVYFRGKKFPEAGFAVLFFWCSLLPITNIIPLSAPAEVKFSVADRFLYIPSFAFCLLMAMLITRLDLGRGKYIARGLLVGLLLFYTGGTVYANTFWQNDVVFFQHELALRPTSPALNHNLGDAYATRQDYDKAIEYFLTTIALKPANLSAIDRIHYGSTHYRLAYCYYAKGCFQKAITENKKAVMYNDRLLEAHYNLGVCYLQAGKSNLAVEEFVKILKINPTFTPAADALKKLMEKNPRAFI